MSEIRATTISDSAGTGPITLTGQSAAKLELRYDQTTNTVNQSLNVSSVTDVSTGQFHVNFTNDFDDTLYRVGGSSDNGYVLGIYTSPSPSVSSVRILSWVSAYSDRVHNNVIIFGDLT